MRYIDLDQLDLPSDWEAKAKKALSDLKLATSTADRKKIIKDNDDLWQDLKDALGKLSHGKCWYCEAREARSDNAVDHFRPKNRVAECGKSHEGYWWLAFDSSNYRFSCTFCNSRRVKETTAGGKQDHFPLLDETSRAYAFTDNISLEQPILLDPTNPDDPELIWFYRTGMPTPSYDKTQDAIKYRRANESIRLYHLDEKDIVEDRQDLYIDLEKIVDRANDAYEDMGQAKDPIVKARAEKRFRKEAKEIRKAISAQSRLSGTAKVYLKTIANAKKFVWLDRLVTQLKVGKVTK